MATYGGLLKQPDKHKPTSGDLSAESEATVSY